MVKRALLILLALLFSFPCDAGMIIRGSGGGGGGISEVGAGSQRASNHNTTCSATISFPGNVTSGNYGVCLGASYSAGEPTIDITKSSGTATIGTVTIYSNL